jgi:hypothetical protein
VEEAGEDGDAFEHEGVDVFHSGVGNIAQHRVGITSRHEHGGVRSGRRARVSKEGPKKAA